MARKGSSKVRTGCQTCKARKVKCDEGKPACFRCTNTGRKCDGYATPDQTAYSWTRLLNGQAVISAPSQGRRSREGRALDFFRHVVAPGLSIYLDQDFWTRLVPAALQQEPAIHHAAVAISSLYEKIDQGPICQMTSSDTQFALAHYNQALSHIRTQPADSSNMLLLCVLFVCIEALQKNSAGVIEHCRHGVQILNSGDISPWTRENLLPLFTRMSITPYFFGGNLSNFPALSYPLPLPTPPYQTLDECLDVVDILNGQSIRFIRATDFYRRSPSGPALPTEKMCIKRAEILGNWAQWLQGFTVFQVAHPAVTNEDKASYALALMKAYVFQSWVGPSLDKTERGFDEWLPTFRNIVELAEGVIATPPLSGSLAPTTRSKFIFETGFAPMLYHVVIRCRDLTLRRAALAALHHLAFENEGLWDTKTLSSIGRHNIELEHGIDLDAYDRGEEMVENFLPPDRMRVCDAITTYETRTQLNAQGVLVPWRRMIFLLRSDEGLVSQDEWLDMGTLHGAWPGFSPGSSLKSGYT